MNKEQLYCNMNYLKCKGEIIMEKVLEIDENLVGYKKDLLMRLEREFRQMVESGNVDDWELENVAELLKDIENNANNYTLISVGDHPMGGLYWKYCEINEID